MQRKRAVEREAIECASFVCGLRGGACSETVLTLVQKRSGLLSAQRLDYKAQSVLQDLQLFRRIAVNRAAISGSPSSSRTRTSLRSITARGLKLFDEYLSQHRLNSISALRQCLHHEHIA